MSQASKSESVHDLQYVELPSRKNKRQFSIQTFYDKNLMTTTSTDSNKSRKVEYPEYHFYGGRFFDILEIEEVSKDLPATLSEEKQRLEKESFVGWSKNDFKSFVDGLERNGRKYPEKTVCEVAKEIGKPESEIQRYHDTFWLRYRELTNYDEIIENIDETDAKISKIIEVKRTIDEQVARHAAAYNSFTMKYGSSKGRLFSDEEDAFLVLMLHKYGYGSWEKIRLEIKSCWLFRYDWYFKSRSCSEIQKRCEVLLRLIEKENEEFAAEHKVERVAAST